MGALRGVAVALCCVVALWICASAVAWAGARGDLGVVRGWSAVTPSEIHDRTTVWQAIDGAAELYLAYGMRTFEQREYRQGKRLRVVVQLFDMNAALNAFGVFSRERPVEAKPLAVSRGTLTAAVIVGSVQCLAYRGPLYLRAQAIGGELTAAACAKLLGGIARALPGSAAPPGELAWLPSEGRIAHSAGFALKSCFGLRELERCVHARYRGAGQGKPHQVFVIASSASDAAATWRALEGRWKRSRQGRIEVLSRSVPYRGTVAVARSRDGRRIHGVAGLADLPSSAARLAEVLASSPRPGPS